MRLIAVVAGALVLSGCATSISDRIASEYATSAETREERVVRAAGIVTVVSEVVAVTVRWHTPQNTPRALSCLRNADATVGELSKGEVYWLETRLRGITRQCAGMVSSDFKAKVMALLNPGLDFSAISEAADQVATGSAGRRDAVWIAENTDEPLRVYRERLQANIARLEQISGTVQE